MERELVITLFEIYGKLLTDKQKKYISQYYFMDYSMPEIAESEGVSRSAVSINIKQVISHLQKYESKLQIYNKRNKRLEIISKIKNNENSQLIEELIDVDFLR